MNRQEKIEDQYRLLGLAINWRGPDKHNQLKCIRRHLGAIRELSEPETLASSVLRLTNLCNELEAENATLRNDLTDMTLNYNAAEKHARRLSRAYERDITKLKAKLASRETWPNWFKLALEQAEP